MSRNMIWILIGTAAIVLLLTTGCSSIERSLLFHPTHEANQSGLSPWTQDGVVIGYAREVAAPKNVWLMLHGNAGQAVSRVYALPKFSPEDSVFIMEYPGYGLRDGVPSRESFNQAAKEAYLLLRKNYPAIPVCVVGESIGTGPASSLATLDMPPDKLVLVTPFDQLSLVAKEHFPSWMVALLLRDNWNNSEALAKFKNPVQIFGAQDDTLIPVAHAKALAASVPSSTFVLIEGGHNDWSYSPKVQIRNP